MGWKARHRTSGGDFASLALNSPKRDVEFCRLWRCICTGNSGLDPLMQGQMQGPLVTEMLEGLKLRTNMTVPDVVTETGHDEFTEPGLDSDAHKY